MIPLFSIFLKAFEWLFKRTPWSRRLTTKSANDDAEIRRLRADLEKKRRELEQGARELQSARLHLEHATATVSELRKENDRFKAEVRRLTIQEEDQAAHSENLERDLARALEDVANLRAEALAAQPYLRKIDDVSEYDVVKLVEKLNSQVHQTAVAFSNAPELAYGDCEEAAAVEQAQARLEQSACIPRALLSSLRSLDGVEEDRGFLVELAVKAGLTIFLQHLANRWDVSGASEPAILKELHFSMRSGETQAVSAKWRALSRTYIRRLRGANEDSVLGALLNTLSGVVADILIVCGAVGKWEDIVQLIKRKHKRALRNALTLAIDFQRNAGEGVISSELEVFAAEPGAPFDPSLMQATRASAKISRCGNPVVLCATRLGLLAEETDDEAVVRGEAAVVKQKVLLKCEVELVEEFPEDGTGGEQKKRGVPQETQGSQLDGESQLDGGSQSDGGSQLDEGSQSDQVTQLKSDANGQDPFQTPAETPSQMPTDELEPHGDLH